ncbi:Protein of unknown function DUF935 [uncultured Caudovirales phage]|uniref:DUF935 family protein n=1 Tax=uncultured Caudovirales phage TaxID=2100421 RepID=A0A6J5SV00_9CAUD|nr:Protein of unknown function DUF935 [uncultured Caudovirales phage]
MKAVGAIKNYWSPAATNSRGLPLVRGRDAKDLSRWITPIQLTRLRQDMSTWRDSIREIELAWYPHRVKVQQMYLDTVLDSHVSSCMSRRKDLTLLKDFIICGADGIEDENLTKLIKNKLWFQNLLTGMLDAAFYGYTLIQLGDLVDGGFPHLSIVKRENISPDRLSVNQIVYSPQGWHFMDPYEKDENGISLYDWTVYIPTFNENGTSICGYGLLYKIARYEILLRNNLGWNADFVELFAQPLRVGKTSKQEGPERDEFEASVKNVGSSGWAVMDHDDVIQFIESALGGTGYKSYDNLDTRLQKLISKELLGHADALDSTPGKLGGGQGGEESPAGEALKSIEKKDNALILIHLNDIVLPKLRNLGFNIPNDKMFGIKNDKELAEGRNREDDANQKTALVANTLKQAGFTVDPAYITERTGIPVTETPAPAPMTQQSFIADRSNVKRIAGKLKEIYEHSH